MTEAMNSIKNRSLQRSLPLSWLVGQTCKLQLQSRHRSACQNQEAATLKVETIITITLLTVQLLPG